MKRVYEVDPLVCPECGATMKVISFIEPPQEALMELLPIFAKQRALIAWYSSRMHRRESTGQGED